MKYILGVSLLSILLIPAVAGALSPDFSTIPPRCQIEGEILSVTQKEAYADAVWEDLSSPARYELNIRVLKLSNPDLDNGYGNTCQYFYKEGKKAVLSMPLVDANELGVPVEQMHIAGTVRGMVAETRLESYTLSTERPDGTSAGSYQYTLLIVVALVAVGAGFLLGRRKK